MSQLKPSDIRFSQDSIANHFKNDTKRIGETLDELLLKRTALNDIPTITVCSRNGLTFTSDNRRLWVFRKLENLGECETITVRFGYIQPYKFTTYNSGTSIEVRGDPGGRAWRTWNKAKMNATPSRHEGYSSPSRRREGTRKTYEQLYEEGLLSLRKTHLSPSSTVFRDSVIKLSPTDVGFFQIRRASYGNNLGEQLDELLLSKVVMKTCSLEIFEYNDRYYTRECNELWLIKTLQKFGKKIEIRGIVKNRPFYTENSLSVLYSLNDSLKITTPIGGVHWKKAENILKLPNLEDKIVPVSSIYFTAPAISDIYEEDSIAKVLVHSFATMTIPGTIRVIEHNGDFYALDNEILWVLKENEKIKGSLDVCVEVKMQMDGALFSSFTSGKIEMVDIIRTSHKHTDEEEFILQYIKKFSA